uniref:Uncharacterized protein n=1 Tax=viral metagenome TaxID=1070528 RepID=A0A6C0I9G6_9ZZZZ
MKLTTQILFVSLLIILASFIITKYLNKDYSFAKLSGFMLFYYALMLSLGYLLQSKMKNGKLIGSVIGFVLSVLLWFKFGKYAYS